MRKILALIAIASLQLVWCGNAFSKDIGYGEIREDVYFNQYFDLSIPVPNDWAVQSKAAIEEISELGSDLISGDDKNLQAILKEADKQTINMFAFFKYEQGAPVDFNPSMMAVAERVAHMPGIKRGSDYHFHVKKVLQSGQLKYSFPKEIYTKVISSISFDVMPAEITLGSVVIHQEYYAARINDYVLGFILSYSSESELEELNQAIGLLKFSD